MRDHNDCPYLHDGRTCKAIRIIEIFPVCAEVRKLRFCPAGYTYPDEFEVGE